jgi:putative transposase
VHPLLVGQWKGIIRERLPELFERPGVVPDESERLIAQLHQKIGQLTVDLDWLKKKSKQLGLSLRDER